MKLSETLINTKNTIETIANQKKVASDILYMLAKNGHPEAVVAGGAPRNWDFGKAANDLDIYLRSPFLEKQLLEIIGVHSFKTLGKNYGGYGLKAIKNVIEANLGGMTVQFISVDCNYTNSTLFAKHVFLAFDFGICKIAWTPSGFITSKEFQHDKLNKTLTIDMLKVCTFNDPKNLPRRLKKMRSYYPDFAVDIV